MLKVLKIEGPFRFRNKIDLLSVECRIDNDDGKYGLLFGRSDQEETCINGGMDDKIYAYIDKEHFYSDTDKLKNYIEQNFD